MDAIKEPPGLADEPTSVDEDLDARRARLASRRSLLQGVGVLAATIRRDHERLAALIDRLFVADPGPDRQELWDEVFAGLTAHAHAEEETVYERLGPDERTRALVERCCEEHERMEDLLLTVDGTSTADPAFPARVVDLRRSFGAVVRCEEQMLLPVVERILDGFDLEAMEHRFRQRRVDVEQEIRKVRASWHE